MFSLKSLKFSARLHMYYGDQTIEGLIRHTHALNEEIGTFLKEFFDQSPDENEEEELEEISQHLYHWFSSVVFPRCNHDIYTRNWKGMGHGYDTIRIYRFHFLFYRIGFG